MFNKYAYAIRQYKKNISRVKNNLKQYTPLKTYNFFIGVDIFVHSGNSLILRTPKNIFKYRGLKNNVLFKKPLVRPTKRKKSK